MLLEKKIKLCTSLTPLEIQIAQHILTHKEEVMTMSAKTFSDEFYVSKSALHRFCKKIGLNGFNDVKFLISQDITAEMKKNADLINVNYPFKKNDSPKMIAYQLQELYEVTIKDTFDYIDFTSLSEIVKLLHEAKVIDIYTHSHNLNAAENFQDKMLTIGRIVNCPKTFYKQRMNILASDQSHAAVILSYSGKATFILPVIKMLYEKHIPVILICKAGGNYYPQYVCKTLEISDKENLRDRISQFASHIAVQYMLDVIYGCLYNMDRDKNNEYLKNGIYFMDDRPIE